VAHAQATQLRRAQTGIAEDPKHGMVADTQASAPVRHAQEPVIVLWRDRVRWGRPVPLGGQLGGDVVHAQLTQQDPNGGHLHPQRRRRQALAAVATRALAVVASGQQDLKGQVLSIGGATQAVGQPADEPGVDPGVVLAGLGAGAALGGHVGGPGQQPPTLAISHHKASRGLLVDLHQRALGSGGRGHSDNAGLQ
jgi:hypothetical protein